MEVTWYAESEAVPLLGRHHLAHEERRAPVAQLWTIAEVECTCGRKATKPRLSLASAIPTRQLTTISPSLEGRKAVDQFIAAALPSMYRALTLPAQIRTNDASSPFRHYMDPHPAVRGKRLRIA